MKDEVFQSQEEIYTTLTLFLGAVCRGWAGLGPNQGFTLTDHPC